MDIMNVIKVVNNVVTWVSSFPVVDEQLGGETVQEAEDLFKKEVIKIVKSEEGFEDSEEMERYLDDEYFEYSNGGNKISLNLSWSYVEDL